MNPDDYVISRKRKKYKFAKFYNAKNCFELGDWKKTEIDIIEIGAGTGIFSVELAMRHIGKQVVAVDVKADRLQKGAYYALEKKLNTVSFVRARADQIDALFPEHCLEQIWLTFPDPFPRPHSARRRMTHPIYFEKYKLLLKKSGSLFLKHDDPDFFQWSLEQFVKMGWRIEELSFDVHESDLIDEYKITTTYEKRWREKGRTIGFTRVTPPK